MKKDLLFIILSLVLLLTGLFYEEDFHNSTYNWIEYLVFLTAYLLVGWKILFAAAKNIYKGKIFDENFLMSIATLGAVAIHQLPEAVAVMLFFKVGEYLQDLVVDRSLDSIESLLNIRPDYANLIINGEMNNVNPDEVKINDEIIVKPGEKIPLDGTIISGSSFVDTSTLTGESIPKSVKQGDNVLAGMINSSGLLNIKVTKLFKDSSLSKIMEYTEQARLKKSESEKFITTFSKYYSPVIVGIALIIALLPPMLISDARFSDWIYRALVLLVISCPCAFVISIPLTYFGGLGASSKHGILIKGSNYLDSLAKVKNVIFDKTGTLTKGNFKVINIVPSGKFSKEELLRYAVIAESHSNHPIAKSIIDFYGGRINSTSADSFEEIFGYGIKIKVDGKSIIAGSDKFLHKENIPHNECFNESTVVHVAVDGEYMGYIAIGDEIKEESAIAVSELKKNGIKNIFMFTGDNTDIAKNVADIIGIEKYEAELLPENKYRLLEDIIIKSNKDDKTVFVGDGINDAPVIARADVGIAMGGLGSDASIDSSNIVIMCDSPMKVPYAIRIAKATRKTVWQNIYLAFLVKLVFIILGSLGLATMWGAVFADVGVTLLVVLNSIKLLKFKI